MCWHLDSIDSSAFLFLIFVMCLILFPFLFFSFLPAFSFPIFLMSWILVFDFLVVFLLFSKCVAFSGCFSSFIFVFFLFFPPFLLFSFLFFSCLVLHSWAVRFPFMLSLVPLLVNFFISRFLDRSGLTSALKSCYVGMNWHSTSIIILCSYREWRNHKTWL